MAENDTSRRIGCSSAATTSANNHYQKPTEQQIYRSIASCIHWAHPIAIGSAERSNQCPAGGVESSLPFFSETLKERKERFFLYPCKLQ
jgi:hypothetical protein